jgi:hypothetical protein
VTSTSRREAEDVKHQNAPQFEGLLSSRHDRRRLLVASALPLSRSRTVTHWPCRICAQASRSGPPSSSCRPAGSRPTAPTRRAPPHIPPRAVLY